jgi:hypothetical protein
MKQVLMGGDQHGMLVPQADNLQQQLTFAHHVPMLGPDVGDCSRA